MILKRLEIELKEYGEDKGKHVGRAVFAGPLGTVGLVLTPDHVQNIFKVCADSLVTVAKEAATNLTSQIIDSKENLRQLENLDAT